MTVFQAPDGFETIVSSVLFKKVVAEGTSEVKILAGSTVKVHYTGKLFSDLSIFDSSVERGEPFSFKIGKGQVIKGWDEGVKTMKLGEKADLLMLPEYGYGANGSPPKIPPDAILLFEVELLAVDPSTAEISIAERIRKASPLKDEGNSFFKENKLEQSEASYLQAIKFLEETFGATPEESKLISQLNISLFSNLAAVSLKLNKPKKTVEYCEKVISFESNHAKAIYRLSQGYLGMGNYELATNLLQENKELLVDVDVDNEVRKILKVKALAEQNEKKMYSKMFA